MPWTFAVYNGTPAEPNLPMSTTSKTAASAGGPADWLTGGTIANDGSHRYGAQAVFRIQCDGAFSAGADLAVGPSAGAVAATSGDHVVARALESSSGSGSAAWAVWASFVKP